MKELLRKLFDHITKWNYYTPIGEYRYEGHPTIYKSSTDTFKLTERAILVHRYLHRKLKNKCYRFYITTKEYDHNDDPYTKTPLCWSYGMVVSICHQNTHDVYGYLDISYVCGTTGEWKNIKITPWTNIVVEEVSMKEYTSILNKLLITQ